jgi:hypothetical protein
MDETTAVAKLNALLGDVDMMAVDDDGLRIHIPADVRISCCGPNRRCVAAHRAGRRIHVIPPKSENLPLLSLTTYHFVTLDDAVDAITRAWNDSPTVRTSADRDAGYRRGISMWIERGAGNR